MRIIAGTYKGRILQSPKKYATHPMSEKIRGALFNALGDISGLTVFDAYGGSGAVGLEAISRGANTVSTCDIDKGAIKTMQINAAQLGVTNRYNIVQANCASYIKNNPQQFNIVIADPPYNDVKVLQIEFLAAAVKDGGVYVLSLPPNIDMPYVENCELLQTKTYGDATLYYYKRHNN